MEELEKSEREAKRLEEALDRGRVSGPSYRNPLLENSDGEGLRRDAAQEETPVFTPPRSTPAPSRRRGSSLGLLNAISYTVHGLMDVDPETARRNGISKTRETISQVRSFYYPSFWRLITSIISWKMPFISPLLTPNTPTRVSKRT